MVCMCVGKFLSDKSFERSFTVFDYGRRLTRWWCRSRTCPLAWAGRRASQVGRTAKIIKVTNRKLNREIQGYDL